MNSSLWIYGLVSFWLWELYFYLYLIALFNRLYKLFLMAICTLVCTLIENVSQYNGKRLEKVHSFNDGNIFKALSLVSYLRSEIIIRTIYELR